MTQYGNSINLSDPIKMTKNEINLVKDFDCGNEVINEYLKSKSHCDPQTVTYIVIDNDNGSVICYYSLSCSGFVIESNHKFTIYPAVEIKMFAIDENYQHMPYSEDIEDGSFSDILFSDVIGFIYDFTENYCGADKIILYSVPDAKSFYIRNGFTEFMEYMLKSESWFLDGCVPMYLDL